MIYSPILHEVLNVRIETPGPVQPLVLSFAFSAETYQKEHTERVNHKCIEATGAVLPRGWHIFWI